MNYNKVFLERYGANARKVSLWLIVGSKYSGYLVTSIRDVSHTSLLGETFEVVLEDSVGNQHSLTNNQEPGAMCYYVNPEGKLDRVPSELQSLTYKDWRACFREPIS